MNVAAKPVFCSHSWLRGTQPTLFALGFRPPLIRHVVSTHTEDVRLVESVQRGLHSRGYRPSPLVVDPAHCVNSEHSIQAIQRWIREADDPQ